jgi:hypothetical protein
MHTIAETTFEAVTIKQGQEKLEVFLFAIVGGGGHQQEVARQAGEQLAEPVALGIFDLATEEGGGELVRLVADDEVPTPVRRSELGLYIFVAGELVEPGDDEVIFQQQDAKVIYASHLIRRV